MPRPAPSPLPWTLRAFGMTIGLQVQVHGAVTSDANRSFDICVRHGCHDRSVAGVGWYGDDVQILLERRLHDGTLGMQVEQRRGSDLRVNAPGYGDFFITADGTQVECFPNPNAGWLWQRALFAQVLPVAATMRGLEMLHASAVVLGGRAVAFTARSGTGKTSVAAHLAARGAPWLADDVVAVSCDEDAVTAHPGAPIANVAEAQLEAMGATARTDLGVAVGETDKHHIALSAMPHEGSPLDRIYFLERGGHIPALRCEPVEPAEPRWVMSATFLPHMGDSQRLLRHLDATTEIVRSVRLFRLLAPLGVSAPALAATVEQHFTSTQTV